MSGDMVNLNLYKTGETQTGTTNNNYKKAEASDENIFTSTKQNDETEDSSIATTQEAQTAIEDVEAAYEKAMENLKYAEKVEQYMQKKLDAAKQELDELKNSNDSTKIAEAERKVRSATFQHEIAKAALKKAQKEAEALQEQIDASKNEEIPEGSEVKESELEDGTKCTEITKPDGSIKLILEGPEGNKTETNYDSQLYPQSQTVYDENGKKTSESTFKYDEDEPNKSWESATYYDENGNVEYTSETESTYPEDEGFKYGEDIAPESSVTVVKDAQGEYVKTITYKNNRKQETTIEFADGSKERHYITPGFNREHQRIEVATTDYYRPNEDELYKRVFEYPDGETTIVKYLPNGEVEVHSYDADGNEMDY